MNWLAEICIKRPVFATVLILVFLVFGLAGYIQLGVDRFPKIDIPVITVTTRQPGTAPEEIETQITDKIEEAVNTVSGIEELRSISAEGISQVFISFSLEQDVDVASQDVRDRINRIIPELPKDVDQPTVEKMDPDSAPILTIAVSAPVPIRDITEYCDKTLRRRLETIAGVGQVMLLGGQSRQINVRLDPWKMKAQNITVARIAQAISSQNLQVPGGQVKLGDKEYTVRTLGRVQNMDEMTAIAVDNQGGRTITIGDLGFVEDSTEDPESVSFLNDTPAVLLQIRKQSGTNTVAVVHGLKERLKELVKLAPKEYKIEIVRDQSVFIESAADAVKEHLFLGSLLAGIIVLLFLANVRATVIAALAIPTSIITTFAVVYFMGFTLNMITLLALTLSVGIVIDDAIVVMENIFRYIEEKNYPPFEAALAATKEIGLAVLAITISLIAVFLPIAFMGGIIGQFLKSYGITMAAAVLVSMIVSFSLTPMISARWFKRHKPTKQPSEEETSFVVSPSASQGRPPKAFLDYFQRFYDAIEHAYRIMLEFSLRHRWIVVTAAFLALASVPFQMKLVRVNFLPDDDESQFQVSVQAIEGTTLEQTQVIIQDLARKIRQMNGVKYTVSTVADTDQRNPNKGNIYVKLVPLAERNFGQLQAMDYIRENVLPKIKNDKEYAVYQLRLAVTAVAAFSGGGMTTYDIQYVVGGSDMNVLEKAAKKVMEDLRNKPEAGAVDIDSSLTAGNPQIGVAIDRPKAAELGVSVADIANTLRLLVAGDKISDYDENGEQYEVHIRAIAELRNQIDRLELVTVPSSKYGTVSLRDVVKFEPGTGPSQINRLNRARQVTILANKTPRSSEQGIIDVINESVAKLKLGPEYVTTLVGRSKEMARAVKGFITVVILSFIFVYLVIAAQFESWIHPITILLSLPLTIPFAILSLIIFNQSLNIFSMLGILVLFAVVKKNSILQIDHTNQLREKGMPKHDAMIQANIDRLRPILMTTVAFVAGMLPLMISNAEGAATNRAISAVVVGGQTLSLLLTLLATPVAYSLFDDVSNSRPVQWLIKRASLSEEGE